MFYVSKIEGRGKKTQVFVTDTVDGVTEPISLQDAEDLMNKGIRIEGVYRHYEGRRGSRKPTDRAEISCRGSFTDMMSLSIGDPVLLDRAEFSNHLGIFLGHALIEEEGAYGILIYSTDDLSVGYWANKTSIENLYLFSCRQLIKLTSIAVVIKKSVSGAVDMMQVQKSFRDAGGLGILSQNIFIRGKERKVRVTPGV